MYIQLILMQHLCISPMIIQTEKRYIEYQRLKFGSHLTIKAIYKQYKFLPCHLSVKGENIAKQNTLL